MVEMMNPLSLISMMRANLLLAAISHSFNQNRQQPTDFLEEKHTAKGPAGITNKPSSTLAAGHTTTDYWNQSAQANEYFFMKGMMEALLQRLGLNAAF